MMRILDAGNRVQQASRCCSGGDGMAIYEFVCRACQKGFEVMRPMSESSASVMCPHCGSADVERTWSTVQTVTSKKS
jgi:putative FmdB family regulatory protein